MLDTRVIQELAENVIGNEEIFLVDVSVTSGNKITILVDSNEGIKVDQCVMISRKIEALLDRDKEDYALEVSSPGLGTPLKVIEQYRKNVGRELELVMTDQSMINGKLTSVSELEIQIEVKIKGSSLRDNLTVELDKIKTAKVKIIFNQKDNG